MPAEPAETQHGAPPPPTSDPAVERFILAEHWGEVRRDLLPIDLEVEVGRLSDPGAARRTLHWGRSYLYCLELRTAGGALPVVVKQFRNEGLRARLRRRFAGSKAQSSWRAARALRAAGVPTPEPVMLIESKLPRGPSYYVSREIEGFVESRYLFRALNQGREAELYPGVDLEVVFAAMGRVLRRLHEGGVWHRDLSIGNLLVGFEDDDPGRPRIQVVDLNRARCVTRLSLLRRVRDQCRLPVLARPHRRAFLGAYWGPHARAFAFKEALFVVAARAFLLKNRLKAVLRRPLAGVGGALGPRRPHPHIPPPAAGASARDKVVWDQLSDQPHQHAGRLEKTRELLADAGIHLEAAAAALPGVARTLGRYRALSRRLYAAPHPWGGVGVGVRPWPPDPEAPVAALAELGVDRVLLRLHPWQEEHRLEEELARELRRRGCDVAFTLPQNRDLVRDAARWRASLERIAAVFLPFGHRFQIGQAVNRTKWGVWNYREALDLAAVAAEVLGEAGDVELLGPSVIDFELHATIALVNMRPTGRAFDGLASLLYVDRRGAPENRQLGFDTVDKVVLLKAVAETARFCGAASWITEFNWPLREGPHAPAGRRVAVDEERQADYLTRFYLLALGTGLVEGAYWWQLVARGYGLIDPEGLRRRPAFRALAHLRRRLAGATFVRPLGAPPPARLYLFESADEGELVVGWSPGGAVSALLPRPAAETHGRDGEALASPGGKSVELGSSPRYFRLQS